ncbi:serine/arginine repetitive matrix protein 1-like [Boleophthalmus pectinirostris]|uniref:serine/arginine repetitive matrix protein 1-like n=1 Tax=Boleophthalmus pectinirostris TaxID=150288 RepID=UPI000A1C25DF|nr:serine/arginine repetitive matrix protein 1-like [Boleophthalmus pectinirostris]
MYSNKSDYDYGQRPPNNSRESRPWEEAAKREEWSEPARNSLQDAYNNYIKYSEDGHSRAERVGSRGHGKTYSSEHTSDKDWRRKRPLSTERTVSEKKLRTFGDKDQRRYQAEYADSYRQSPEHYSHGQRNETVDEGYSHNITPEELSRYGQRQEEFHYSQYKEESHNKSATEYYKDQDSRERSWSQDRTHSRDVFEKSYSPPRLRSGSYSRDHEDHSPSRTMYPLNGSSRQTELGHHRLSPPPIPPPPPPVEKKMSKGFQRFLDVLNMGVNVETLTKIVNQGSPDVNVRQPSSPPLHTNRPWTDEPNLRQQFWPETERSSKPPFSSLSRSYSSNGKTLSEERVVESRQFERKFPENRSASPTNKNSSFEEDNKRKQMHDVLQAIGINLEFEELGQMSSRIQERLYGKKQTEHALVQKEELERERKRRAYIPKCRSRSSSDSSLGSFKDYKKNPSYSSQKEETDYSYYTDKRSTQPSATKHNVQMVPPTSYSVPNAELPPAPVITPSYTPTPNYPPASSVFIPQYHSSYPQPPPLPPFPPPNMFPPFVPPNASVPPPPMPHPFLPNLFIPHKHLPMETNAQKANSKNLQRPRCLQVISTKK